LYFDRLPTEMVGGQRTKGKAMFKTVLLKLKRAL